MCMPVLLILPMEVVKCVHADARLDVMNRLTTTRMKLKMKYLRV